MHKLNASIEDSESKSNTEKFINIYAITDAS